jgi:hypothetical protein
VRRGPWRGDRGWASRLPAAGQPSSCDVCHSIDASQLATSARRHARWLAARLHDPVEATRSYGAAVQAGECILLLVSEGPAGNAELESAAVLKHAVGMAGAQPLWPDPIVAWIGHRNDVREFYRYVASGMLVDTIDVATRWSVVADLYDAALADLHAGLPRSRSPQPTPRIAMLRARTCTSSLQPSRHATLRTLSGCSDRSGQA